MRNATITRDATDRQTQAEALHTSIVEQVRQLADSGRWRAFLEVRPHFPQLQPEQPSADPRPEP